MLQQALLYLRSHRLMAIAALLLLLVILGISATLAVRAFAQGQVQNCGTVHTLGGHLIHGENPASVRKSEDCFWQAYHEGRSATLTLESFAVDVGLIHTFTTSNGSLTDTVQNTGPDTVPVPARTYTCAGLTQQADGLHFSNCGDEGSVIVPAS